MLRHLVAIHLAPNQVRRALASSSFRGMKAERDKLVKRTFPPRRNLCDTRGMTWDGADIRWSLIDKQNAKRKVLSICLEGIRRCRVYFIGHVGERNGWLTDEVPTAFLEKSSPAV